MGAASGSDRLTSASVKPLGPRDIQGAHVLRLLCGVFAKPLRVYPDEMRACLEYQERISRCAPEPVESSAESAVPCCLVKSYDTNGPTKFFFQTA